MPEPYRLTIPKLFDAHVHLRSGDMLHGVARFTAEQCFAAVVMPNVPEVLTASDAIFYEDAIKREAEGLNFTPLMTIKLTQRTTPGVIEEAKKTGVIAAKLYPTGVTTGSHDGVSDVDALADTFKAMQDHNMILCIHGEAPGVFVLHREKVYLDTVKKLLDTHQNLKIVLEHITTHQAVAFVDGSACDRLAASITAHHLMITLDDVIGSGIRPHNFCYPVAKGHVDRFALNTCVFSGDGNFFLGSDSAPHYQHAKESACGCAGVFTAPYLAQYLAEAIFGKTKVGKAILEMEFADFVCHRGAAFYGVQVPEDTLTLEYNPDNPLAVPAIINGVVPFMAGRKLNWRLV